MTTFLEHFRNGGWGMFPTLAFGLLLLAVATKHALSPNTGRVPLLLALGILTLATGALGFVSGLIRTCAAIEQVHEGAPIIALLGMGESLNNVAFALIFIVLAALAGSYGAWKVSKVSPRPSESSPKTLTM